MYSLRSYGAMIGDPERFKAYTEALNRAVRPGDVVVDLGCGPGQFALLACLAGAKRVYAIEIGDVIDLARQLAVANGFADRIQFFQIDSRRLELPERANLVIADIRGVLPLYDHAVATLQDSRQRFLAPDGTLIPRRDILKAAVVEAESFYSSLTAPWLGLVRGVDLSKSLDLILNETHSVALERRQLLTEPQSWGELNYARGATTSPSAQLGFRGTRAGTAHGICLWFDAELFEDVGYSTGPGAPRSISGQLFLPWPEPVRVNEGQEIHVALRANLIGDEYVFRWDTDICADGGHTTHRFEQSSFYGAAISPASLRRRETGFVPELSQSGRADRWLLDAMDGKSSLQEIAQSAVQHFPNIFPRWEDALRRAADLAAEFSR